jgi:hypothetical protein
MGVRTRAIERKLKGISSLDEGSAQAKISNPIDDNLLDFDQD